MLEAREADGIILDPSLELLDVAVAIAEDGDAVSRWMQEGRLTKQTPSDGSLEAQREAVALRYCSALRLGLWPSCALTGPH